jgi:SAM-dependent methyltransferase
MQPHQLEWTPERIQAFWDHYSSTQAHADNYFSSMFGRSLIDYVRRRIAIGVPLDYGCGRGHLLSYLVDAGCTNVHGVEQSPESREATRAKIGGRAKHRIAADAEPESSDTAFLVEVVEHMDDKALAEAFNRIRVALRPGGHLVITTPNAERLEDKQVLCAECGAIFHTMQHVRSWTPATLGRVAEAHGFETVTAEGTILSIYSGLLDRLWRAAKLTMGARPNLIYIGRKA